MNNKYIKIVTLIFIIINIGTLFWFNKFNENEGQFIFKSGEYYCKVSFPGNSGKRDAHWDISISKKESKNNIIENKDNSVTLEKFRKTIGDIRSRKINIFYLGEYAIFCIVIGVIALKDKRLTGNKKMLQLIILVIYIFVIFKIVDISIQLSRLNKDIVYYYNLI